MLHGFNLVVKSLFGHPFAVDVLKKCSRLINVVLGSQQLKALLWEAEKAANISRGLEAAGTTRFSSHYNSMHTCLEHENVLRQLKERHGNMFPPPGQGKLDARDIISSREFWRALELLTPLMEAFQKVSHDAV